jgi:hypothetical protein
MVRAASPHPRRPRAGTVVGLGGILVLALLVRAWLIPAFTRHGWEGHEAEYLAVFDGSWQGGWSTRVMPLLGWCYRGLGVVVQEPWALVAVALCAGLGSIVALARVVRCQAGDAPAMLAALLVALYGNHAFWSSSAYNVVLPHALLLGAAALLTQRGWWALVGSAVLLGAAAGGRVELVVYTLPLLVLLRGHSWVQRSVWGGTALLVLACCLLPISHQGTYPEGLLTQVPAALRLNLLLPVFLEPFSGGAALLLPISLTLVALWRRPEAASLWLALLLVGHGSSACFADSGFRHALLPGVALCALCALGIHALWLLGAPRSGVTRWLPRVAAGVALAAVILLLAMDSADLGRRYYAPAGPLIEELTRANPQPADTTGLAGCSELITTPARSPDEHSPFEVLDPDACWVWVEDFQHRRWTSLGVHDRARRMHRVFLLEPMGMLTDPVDPGQPPRQLWRVSEPR